MAKQFGNSRYLYQQGDGTIVDKSCCPTSSPPIGTAMWVALTAATSSNSILYSPDGVSWYPSNGSFDFGGGGVTYAAGKWVAVGGSVTKTIQYSTDGINWNDTSGSSFTGTGGGGYGLSVAYGGGTWVAVGTSDISGLTTILWSPDGITWQDGSGGYFGISIFSFSNGTGVAYGTDGSGEPLWVAVGTADVSGRTILHSADGRTWVDAIGANFTDIGYSVAYGGGKWVATGYYDGSGHTLLWSDDGTYWNDASGVQILDVNNGIPISGIDYGADNSGIPLWVATGHGLNGHTILNSRDGMNWYNAEGAPFASGYGIDVAYGDKWVAVGTGIVHSPDGYTWTPGIGGGGGYVTGVATNGCHI